MTIEMDDDPRPYRLGVGVVLLNGQGQVWVGERIRKVGTQLENPWQMPQGGLDPGEDPQDAALRELEEESGIVNAEVIREADDWLIYDLPLEIRDRVWKGKFRGQKQKWFALRFLGGDEDVNLNAHHKPEFSSWRWVEMSELLSMVVPFKRPLYAQIIDAFKDLASDHDNPLQTPDSAVRRTTPDSGT